MSASAASAVRVIGLGAETPVGRSPAAMAAAVRARVSMVALHPFIVDRYGEPVKVVRATWLPADLNLLDRVLTLATAAVKQAMPGTPVSLSGKRPRLAVVVGLPAPRPGLPSALDDAVLNALTSLVPAHFELAARHAYLLGHVAGLVALENGCRLIQEEKADCCLVGGAESYIDRATLEWLDWTWQLHARTHPWGFIPGEGAGFCLLASERYVAEAGLPVLGTVLGTMTVLEGKLRRDHQVCVGEGLTESVRRTLAHLPASAKVDQMVCDLNGQTHRADEFGFTMTRLGGRFVDPGRFQTPADCWGDVGAASGPLYVGLAIVAGKNDYAAGPNTLLATSAMVAERSTALIHVSSDDSSTRHADYHQGQ